ncbi:MAG TPA: GAF domain-containing protein [Anaerolineae bacterium]|nr:GAF domain-containing protein [Anaerolineae bacterium]HOQ97448.1 GAF domain-containing protein [Anaerolineae bacterium]HPL27991.1 GAF domain-containing protein [Anaerolineae bacterium]
MATTRQASSERAAERLDEQYPSALGRIILRYYGWFYSAGIAVTGGTLLVSGGDTASAWRVLATSLVLFAFQGLMELLRYVKTRFYDSVGVSRFRAEVYIAAAAILVYLVGGISSPFWLLFALPIAFTAVYGDRSRSFKYLILAQILAFDLFTVWQTQWEARAMVQGLIYAAVFWALLESATWLYVMAHFRQEERLQHLELLKDSAQRLIPQRDLTELAQEALEMALKLAGTHQGFLLIMQQDSGRVLAHAIRGLSLSPGVTVQGLAGRCRSLAERGLQGAHAAHLDYELQFPYGRYFHDRVASALVVPIATARGHCLAVLHLTSPEKGRFQTPAPSLLDVYAGQLATALDNALSSEERDRTLRHYGSLIALGPKLLERLDPDAILDQVVHYVLGALPQAAGAYVFWPDSRPHLYTLAARAGAELGLPALAAVPLHRLFDGSDDLPPGGPVFSVAEADGARWATVGVTTPPFGSLLAAQLRVGAKPMGFLLLGASEPHAFSPVDQVFLGNLAGHVALAYRNAELHQRRQANRGRLARILQEHTTWRLDQSQDALLDQMARSAVRSLGFGAAVIDLYDPERGGYVTRATANLPQELSTRLRGRLVSRDQVNRVLRPGFRLGDANVYFVPSEARAAEADWTRYRQALGLGHAGPAQWRPDDVLLVPLRRRDGLLLGILALDNPDDKGRPTDDEGHVYENLAEQMVATLEQWRQNAKLQRLGDILARLIEETEASALYQFIVEAGARLLEAEDCSLFLNNTRSGMVEFEASSCIPKEMFERKAMPISAADGAGLTAYVAATGTALFFADDSYRSHPAWEGRFTEHLEYLPSRGCHSLALIALRYPGGRITGVLKVENKRGLDASAGFTEFDREILLPTLANAAAIAIERAHFYWRTGQVLVQKERDRLAGELHDLANVFHMGIMLRIEKLWEQVDSAPQHTPAQTLRQLWRASRYVFGELKKMHEETRHPILIQEGLIQALAHHSQTINLTGVQFSDGIGGRLPVDVEHALYRIAQEALSNAKKHFQSVSDREIQVTVALRHEGASTVLEVIDNGPGFDVAAEMRKPESFGLTRMKEIAEGIKARCDVTSQTGRGTRVRVVVPAQQEEPLRVR